MSSPIIIAIDAMGGDGSPQKIIDGIDIALKKNNENFFLLYGDEKSINNYLKKNNRIKKHCEVINTNLVIDDNESPLSAAKKGENSSMWASINSQINAKSHITLSAGNTGALLVISRLLLKTITGIDKPALAGLWPNKVGMNIVLDLGANIECNEKNLIDFSYMGASLYKSLYPKLTPNVALLNIGSEEIKGNEKLKKASNYLSSKKLSFSFNGFVEGNQITDGNVNVIVTDGFTGNIALKTAEGTSDFITYELKKALKKNLINKILSIFSIKALNDFKNKLDPRKYNGAIFLGLTGPVVKSHGSTDALGFAYSIDMCNRIVKNDLISKIKTNLTNDG